LKVLSYIAHIIFGDYALYRIYQLDLPPNGQKLHTQGFEFKHILDAGELDMADDPAINQLAGYAGEDAQGFAALVKGRPVSVCWFWSGKRYRKRNFWPLQPHEAKLVQIVTDEGWRGKCLAPLLLSYAANEMNKLGFRRLYARIWRSNHPSIAAFEKTGWQYIAFVIELFLLGIKRPIRMVRHVEK